MHKLTNKYFTLICRAFVFLGPWPPGSIKFLSVVFDFLPVCVIKYSCAALTPLGLGGIPPPPPYQTFLDIF